MSVLLQKTKKPVRHNVDMGAGVSLDVSKLDVCFGGFTPMALSDGSATREQILEAEVRVRARRESLERAAQIEAARASEERTWCDDAGTIWRYVVLDGKDVRIEGCEPSGPELSIPSVIEDKPVAALATDACAYMPTVEVITCPDSVLSIGFCAFRGNEKLRSIVLPANLAVFDSDWLRGCPNLERLVLPGRVECLDASIFDFPALRHLVVGAGAGEVAPGAFVKSALETVEVDSSNTFLMTDGKALYSRDGSVMVALAVPVVEYEVMAGCRAVAKKGFSNFSCVKHVRLPEGVEVLGEFALTRTGITSFEAPSSLKRIMEKAFFNCSQLAEVHLREGLESVAANAFSGTGIRELRLPASIEELGTPLAVGTNLTYAGPHATFSIAAGSKHLELDAQGGLYRHEADGKQLVRMMNPELASYAVQSGTVAINEAAFANHAHITDLTLPEGLEIIGEAAFKNCRNLVRVNIPAGARRIEKEAFLDTNIASLELPASLEYLGQNSLVTHGAHHGDMAPSLREVTVAAGNEHFYTVPGLLLERKGADAARVVLCMGDIEVIRIPPEVNEIAPYAFNGVVDVTELYLSERIERVGMRGLGADCLIGHIHVDLMKPIEGHESFDICFPDTDRGAQQQMLALSVPDHVDAAVLLEHYDNAIINASSFDARSEKGLSVYDQAKRVVARMVDPVLMTTVNRSLCDGTLKSNIEKICVEAAKHDDRAIIDALLDLGYLNADNLYNVIDRIGAIQDAAMTGYLLEVKRLRFGQGSLDFDL